MYLDKAVNKLLARLQARKKTVCIVSPTVQAKLWPLFKWVCSAQSLRGQKTSISKCDW